MVAIVLSCLPLRAESDLFAEAKQNLTKAEKEITDSVAAQQRAHITAYQQALGRLLRQYKAAGNLDAYLAGKRELERVKKGGALHASPTDSLPSGISALQGRARAAAQQTERDALRRKRVLMQKYIAHLQALVKKLMTQDNMDLAKAVEAERKRAEFVAADMSSRLPQPETRTEVEAVEPEPVVTAQPRIPRSIEESLFLRYPLDEVKKERTIESTGHARPADVIGAQPVAEGKVGAAFSFDGRAYVDAGKPRPQKGSLTICAWIKTTQIGKQRMIVARSDWVPGAWQLMTHYGKPAVEFSRGGQLLGTSNVCDDEWHHIAAVYDAEKNIRYLYVDGQLEGRDPDKPPFRENGNPLYIGLRPNTDLFFEGLIDDVRIYSRRLSDAEVASLFEAFRLPTWKGAAVCN